MKASELHRGVALVCLSTFLLGVGLGIVFGCSLSSGLRMAWEWSFLVSSFVLNGVIHTLYWKKYWRLSKGLSEGEC